jgi:hypothetical protein
MAGHAAAREENGCGITALYPDLERLVAET